MLFVDYTFDVLPNGTILFDKELKLSQLHLEQGDELVVTLCDGRVIFYKKTTSADES